MNILITGGAGYIGSVLVNLLSKKHIVTILDKQYFKEMGVQASDIRTCGKHYFAGMDCVIDLACISNDPACDLAPQLTDSVNVLGAIRIANMARDAGVKRYIYSSTCSVYGDGVQLDLTEESSTKPISLYAKSKLFTERALLGMSDDSFKVVALRNGTVFGCSPSMRFDLVVNIMTMHAWRAGKVTVNDGHQWRPNVHIKDVCNAFEFMVNSKHTGIYNVVGENAKMIDVACMVDNIIPCDIEVKPEKIDKRNYSVSGGKLEGLGFKTTRTIYEGIVDIKQALEAGEIRADDPMAVRVKEYKRLQEQGKL